MCGICGFINFQQEHTNPDIIGRMCTALTHRGPDDEGYYNSDHVRLAMRRLSIIDLDSGQQPIVNEDGSVWLVFNGEVYNYIELRERLIAKGHIFTTSSDSEVIVHAYEEYGEGCVQYLNGMFAFAIWDNKRKQLFIARDRLGIKPLYYWVDTASGQLVFGSELKSLLQHPAVPRDLDYTALDHFLTLEYIPAPRTIYRYVRKLPAGHRLTFSSNGVSVKRYWDVPRVSVPNSLDEAAEQLRSLIQDAVRLRLRSDVPVGAFLSGGIDSSTIVAYMSQLSNISTRTFSIGFGERSYNELPSAKLVSEKFGTQHIEQQLSGDLSDLASELVDHLDEPLGDFSIFPTYLVSKLAREHVTVALAGDGGDELFGGYDPYMADALDRRYYRWMPDLMRQKLIPAMAELLPPQQAKKGTINKIKRFVEGAALPPNLQHTRWMIFMREMDKLALYNPDMAQMAMPHADQVLRIDYFERVPHYSPLAQQQYVDIKTYLAENILTKVDRMSMLNSLEVRVPLLDHRIVEFGLSLPSEWKLNGNTTKVALRHAVKDILPAEILNKPKQGFSIPIKHWLRGPLKPMMMDLLSSDTVKNRGYFRPETVNSWVKEHLDAKANHSHRLWALMVFELWHRKQT